MICTNCVNFDSLKSFIKENGADNECSYCGEAGVCAEQEKIFTFIKNQLFEVLTPTDELSDFEQGMIFECGSDDPHVYPVWEFIQDSNEIAEENVTAAFLEWLPSEYTIDSDGNEILYVFDDGTLEYNDFSVKWDLFVKDINHNHRFFNKNAEEFLDSLLAILGQGGELHTDVIEVMGRENSLYRARITSGKQQIEDISKEPKMQLGPVPVKLAGNQRMSPVGISAMYCSLDRNTCLTELRTIVGDIAISGEFRPISDIKLLNLSLLSSVTFTFGDFLSEGLRKRLHAIEFFKEMTFKLSRPLGRSDELGYLSTQVFFEYLRVKYNGIVDGVLFPSVQTGKKNVNIALFPESSIIGVEGEGVDEIATAHSSQLMPKLYFVNESLMYHRISAVNVTSHDESSSVPFALNEITRNRLFPELKNIL